MISGGDSISLILFRLQLEVKVGDDSLRINSSRPDPGQREKINLNFLFSHFFVVPQKVLWRPLRPS